MLFYKKLKNLIDKNARRFKNKQLALHFCNKHKKFKLACEMIFAKFDSDVQKGIFIKLAKRNWLVILVVVCCIGWLFFLFVDGNMTQITYKNITATEAGITWSIYLENLESIKTRFISTLSLVEPWSFAIINAYKCVNPLEWWIPRFGKTIGQKELIIATRGALEAGFRILLTETRIEKLIVVRSQLQEFHDIIEEVISRNFNRLPRCSYDKNPWIRDLNCPGRCRSPKCVPIEDFYIRMLHDYSVVMKKLIEYYNIKISIYSRVSTLE